MASSVRLLILVAVAAAILVFAAAIVLFPLRQDIGGAPGIVFWTILTLAASALPVRLPRGTIASVSFAPVMATIVLGGPVASGIVAALGTTETREITGKVPWYGTVFNHASLVLAAVSGGLVYDALLSLDPLAATPIAGASSFLFLLVASIVYYVINGLLASAAVGIRTRVSVRTVWTQDVGAIAPNLIGLAPLGWLMAMIFQLPGGVGWWATPLFVIPLFTTRLAYHRYVEARELFVQTISALANAVDARDKYTRGHSDRVKRISGAMARTMHLPEQLIERIEWAGLLHDIGKIGIRDNILLKPGPLDREERILMNQHPAIGAEIVEPVAQLSEEAPLIRSHHEWFNGSGYPDGREALDIPLGARIMTIADAYEAMTASRPYRKSPLSHEQAVAELEKYSGIQFDPEIVPVLVGLDRSILDPTPPDDHLRTMLEEQDAADALRQDLVPQGTSGQLTAGAEQQSGAGRTRPQLASDDAS